jgi:hypothetical protein
VAVVESKFGQSRQLAVDATTTAALRAYLSRSDRPVAVEPTEAVFTSAVGTRLPYCNVHLAFKRIVAHTGLAPRSTVCRPRPHDLRHTFAADALLDAYRHDHGDGEHIQARIALLCTYLGHVNPGSTYWYLQAAPASADRGRRSTRSSQPATRARRRPCAYAGDEPARDDRPTSSTRPAAMADPCAVGVVLALGAHDLADLLQLDQLVHDAEPGTHVEREQPLPLRADELTQRILDSRWERTLRRLQGRNDLGGRYLLHGGSSCPHGLGLRPARSQRERTRREDRHSKFYEISDNLAESGGGRQGA